MRALTRHDPICRATRKENTWPAQRALNRDDTLVARELQHRLRNTLAIVVALANQTLQSASKAEIRAFQERLMALGRTHDLLSEKRWAGVDLRALAASILAPYDDGSRRIQISGPDIEVDARHAILFGTSLSELATNAAKHGALSVRSGRVEISWSAEHGVLQMSWRESGGPAVTRPTKSGFGSRYIELSFRGVGGFSEIAYLRQGVCCRLAIAIPDTAPRD